MKQLIYKNDKIINIFSKLNDYLNSTVFLEKFREKKIYFTRNRKLKFPILITFILNFRFMSTQAELNEFFNPSYIIEKSPPDKSSFFKARKKVKAEAILDLLEKSSSYFYETNLAKKWRGFRLVACDGMDFTIPLTGNKCFDQKLKKYFGTAENQFENIKVIKGHAQVLYDTLNKIVITGSLTAYPANERKILANELDKLNKNDLLLLDRGYPAVWLFALLFSKNLQYVARLQKSFLSITDDFFISNEKDKIIKIKITQKLAQELASEFPDLNIPSVEIKIRLVKVFLDDGEIEVLATSLINQKVYEYNLFKELYFERWSIETLYNILKNKLKLEWLSGKTVKVILQDFYAKLFQKNLFTLVSLIGNDEVKKNDIGRKYEYAVNENIGYGILKNSWVKLLLGSVKKIKDFLNELIKKIIKSIEPIRKDRKYIRVKKMKSKSTMIAFSNRIAI